MRPDISTDVELIEELNGKNTSTNIEMKSELAGYEEVRVEYPRDLKPGDVLEFENGRARVVSVGQRIRLADYGVGSISADVAFGYLLAGGKVYRKKAEAESHCVLGSVYTSQSGPGGFLYTQVQHAGKVFAPGETVHIGRKRPGFRWVEVPEDAQELDLAVHSLHGAHGDVSQRLSIPVSWPAGSKVRMWVWRDER